MRKQILLVLLFLYCFRAVTQNKPILYDFAESPQSQFLNPAFDYNYKKHIGVPFLSGLHAEVGLKSFSLFDFFAANSTTFSQKLQTLTNRLSPSDFLVVNGQLDIINAGFRLKNKNYLSFGFYQETDMILFFPRDPISIFFEGNNINRSYRFSDLNLKFELLGVFHAGISKKITEKLTLGIRLKVYNSLFQAQIRNNEGVFITTQGDRNLLEHRFNNVNLNLELSGVSIGNESNENFIEEDFANNLGLGIDLGFVKQVSEQLKLSASILDFGFINNNKKVQSYTLRGDFNFSGLETDFNSSNGTSPWEDILTEFEESLPFEENTESYISLRPVKVNAALKYSFGKFKSRFCYDNSYKKEFTNAVGVQFFSVVRPRGPQMALTGFYERMLTRNFKTKITYTADSYTFSNIGIGASTKIGNVNFYGTIGNLIQFRDVSKSRHFIAQMGINYIVN